MSWIVNAEKIPNSASVISKNSPMYGNKIIAIAFKRKTRLIEATKSSLFALMIGAREAMAVPPQIAVPETNKRVRL